MRKQLFTIIIFGAVAPLFAQPAPAPVEFLHDTRDKGRFLMAVHQTSKDVREYEDSVMYASGWRSEAHLQAIDSLKLTDSVLTMKIDKYLDHYGFPPGENFDEMLRITPWIVLRNSTNGEIRRKQFSELYKAYKDDDLEERRLLMFLEDEYERVHQKNFQSYSVEKDRIAELMKELDLMPSRGKRLMRMQ